MYLRETKSNEESFLVQITDRTESMSQRICFEIEKKGIKIIPPVFSGIPKKDILKFVKDNKIDLIVIGSQGLGGIKKIKTLGSVSRTISENAQCPVLIIH